jgi:hypothetical protein
MFNLFKDAVESEGCHLYGRFFLRLLPQRYDRSCHEHAPEGEP